MLIIGNDVVGRVLRMEDCIRVQEETFRRIPSGAAIERPRCDVYFPCERTDGYFRWGEMEGASNGYFAIRMKSDIATWTRDDAGAVTTEDKYCVTPGTYCGLVLIVSTRNAEPLAFINDGVMQHMRVGASAAIGAKYLSREDSSTIGMLGSGGMARTYLEALTLVRPISDCKVYSPNAEHRSAFAREMEARLNINVQPVTSAREAVRSTDIVATCTDSIVPVFETEWLEDGMHVTNVNQHDTPLDLLMKVDVAVRQGVAAIDLPESERFQSMRGGTMGAFVGGTVEEMERLPPKKRARLTSRDPEPHFVDLVTGRCPGRLTPEQVTFYRNQGLQGLQFVSVGSWVYEQAVKQQLGRFIPTEWFLQDIRD